MWDDIKDFIVYGFIFITMALCVIIAVGLIVYGVWLSLLETSLITLT